ncbi:MAG TPA: hypothetical protein PKE45_20395, partial [Caldilineaceae bacterium]|nr:hypothetical protein [Caldilineaceae bacterium]
MICLSRIPKISFVFALLLVVGISTDMVTTSLSAQSSLPLCNVGGAITDSAIWTPDCLYVVDSTINIGKSGVLTIQAGTIVKFKPNTSINVEGVLKVQGASDNRVYLTSFRDDTIGGDTNVDGRNSEPAARDWKFINFTDTIIDAETIIEYADIRYGESIYMTAASPTLRNNMISHSYSYALSMDVNSEPKTEGNTLSQNAVNGMEVRRGAVTTIQPIVRTWASTDIVYVVTGYLTYGIDVTLVIKPGVKVKVLPNKLIDIQGALQIQGTPDQPVYFTSLKDDSVGGDTNNDGNNSQATPGDWG